jgi:superoxide dismutase, Cu-Zn family
VKNWKMIFAVGAVAAAVAGLVCSTMAADEKPAAPVPPPMTSIHHITEAVAVLTPTAGNTAHGWVRFTHEGHHTKIVAHVEGLAPNSEHGFHIHEFGDISSPDGMSLGGHFNPEGHKHGAPEAKGEHHAGDMGNIKANDQGVGDLELTVEGLSINGEKDPIIGRGVVVHAKADDLVSQPVGNAGPRIAVGVIGVAKPMVHEESKK